MAKAIDTKIPDMGTSWEGYTGGRVEEFIKEQFGGKFGYMRISSTINENNFYSLEAFASKADAELYDGDPETYKDKITIVTIPISTVQGDAYTSLLATNVSEVAAIVSVKDEFFIPVNFRGVKISQIGNENAGITGTLDVQRRVNNGAWENALTLDGVLTSFNYSDTSSFQDVNIYSALINGVQEIRIRASYQYEDAEGAIKTAYSSWVMIGKTVTKTNLSLELSTDYSQPISLYDPNGNLQNFSINYIPRGEVSKKLYVSIRGSYGTYSTKRNTSENGSVVPAFSINVSQNDSYGLLTHGIKYVEAYLEAEDGMGNTIKSNVLKNQFMVASDASNTKPYLLLQNVVEDAVNYMQTNVCEYAIYSPTNDEVKVALLVTGYTSDYEAEKPEEYFRLEQEVVPNKKQQLTATIEIETESIEDSYAYFRVRRITDDTDTDFIKESHGDITSYTITVDNEHAFTPVAGSTFLINPKVRSNNEETPARIINSRNDNAIVPSTFEGFGFINDGWIDSGAQRVLRVPAGGKLTINRNLWKAFQNNPDSQLNFEIDFAVHNITNTTDPIIDISEDTATGFKGLRMNAMDGWLKSKSYNVSDDCLFSWQEDERTHVFINIENIVHPQGPDVTYNGDYNAIPDPTDSSKLITRKPIARVFINGDIVREIPFNISDNTEWTENGCNIVIGNIGCDIDIYSLRAYETENRNITPRSILMRNYIATLATSAEKQNVFTRNSITDGSGRISLEAAKAMGLNCMVWHGTLPSKINDGEYKGWYEYFRYDNDKQLMKEYSGTNCKASGMNDAITEDDKPLTGKGQGSTAKTYWDWNIQDDNSKVKTTIRVSLADGFHHSISVSEPYQKDGVQYVDITGGNLGKNFPVENKTKAYPYENGYVTVPDGWIDANGKYRGMGYMVSPDTALAQKKVIKINYASSMQSHLLGACKTYDLLHRAVVGNTPLQDRVPTAVSAKHTEPFLLFHEVNGNVYYKGLGTYGAAKMDKVAWGYAKSVHPNFALIEGSDNNMTMTDFRVPFDKNTAVYNCKEEYWEYNGNGSFDFDGGATVEYEGEEDSIVKQMNEGWSFKNVDAKSEAPTANIRDRWAFVCNYIYLHATNLKFHNGTFSSFIAKYNNSTDAEKADYLASKMWFSTTDGEYQAYHLYRYDAINQQWINAGLLGGDDKYKAIDLRTDLMTKKAYEANKGNFESMNNAFKAEIAEHMHKTIKYVINEDSLLFNYCYVLSFLAGTDNSSKNTYFKIMPIEKAFVVDEEFNTWYKEMFNAANDFNFSYVYQVYLDGDDMDSIFRTNNNSHQTKPYYIERRFPYADENPNECLYEGMKNQLFNYVEEYAKLYPDTLSLMLNRILTEAANLVSDTDTLLGLTANKKSAWGFLHKYFFNTQHYFPQVCYNEQARIRYEFPHMVGYISSGSGARNIQPISQSLGSQLQNELQYMKQRLVYMASFARWSELAGASGTLGLSDKILSLSFTGSGIQYKFVLKSYQYIYPTFNKGTTKDNVNVRLKPDTPFEYVLNTGGETGDAGIGLYGIDYYTSIGNVGDFAATNATLTVQGKRLREFIAEPTSGAPFAPKAVNVTASQLDKFSLKGCSGIGGTINLSTLTRCGNIDLSGTKVGEAILPSSANLKTVLLGDSIERLVIEDLPNIEILQMESYDKIQTLNVGRNVSQALDTKNLLVDIYNTKVNNATAQTLPLNSLTLQDINWVNLPVSVMVWLATQVKKCNILGVISILETNQNIPSVTWDIKNKLLSAFGNVDDATSDDYRGLLLDYAKRPFDASTATISGNFFVDDLKVYDKEYNEVEEFVFNVKPYSRYENTQTKITYSVEGSGNYTMEADGTFRVRMYELSKVEQTAIIKANVFVIKDGSSVVESVSKEIEVWFRPAQVGDLVYYDGTYGDAAKDNYEKTVIGVCCYVAPRKADGSINEKFHNPLDKQVRLMISVRDITAQSNSTSFDTWQAGLQPGTSVNAPCSINSNGDREALKINGVEISTIPKLRKINKLGMYKSDGSESGLITDETFRDSTNVGLENDGFKPIDASFAAGDGMAYNELAIYVEERTLDGSLAKLAGNSYSVGDIVNSGYAKTLRTIEHRDTIIRYCSEGNLINNVYIPLEEIHEYMGIDELSILAQKMTDIRNWAKSETGLGDTSNSNVWSQLYFPSASACYAYEPKQLKAGEILSDKFKKHNWFLAPLNLLGRLFWYINKSEEKQFSQVISKGIFINLSKTQYWSSTEVNPSNLWFLEPHTAYLTYGYNKYYDRKVRAMCAF